MPDKHIVMVQFQEGRKNIVSQKTYWDRSPIPVFKVVELLDGLKNEIISQVGDRDLIEKTVDRIDKLIRQFERQKTSMMGQGLGQNFRTESVFHRGREYRVDVELSGEIVGI